MKECSTCKYYLGHNTCTAGLENDCAVGDFEAWEPRETVRVIKANRAKCLLCHEVLESKYTHDFVTCSCGNLSVDGGHSYLRRAAIDSTLYEELSVYGERPT